MSLVITTGGAHSAYGNETKGDQKQSSTPDYSGEVSLSTYESESAFINRYRGFIILRPKSSSDASTMASLMIKACNNSNIGYLYGGKDMVCQGGSNTVETSVACNTDCSGLVSECASEATGTKMYAATSGMVSTFTGSGKFTNIGSFQSYGSTPVYNGDVLVKPGSHTDLVVSGNPRTGTEDETLSQTGINGSGTYTADVTATREGYELVKTFEARRYAPDPAQSGYNYYENNNGVTKNGWYAWSRFSEIAQAECAISAGNPRRWFVNKEDGYMRGVSPSVGAIMCFTNAYDSSDPGYVCIVEGINTNISRSEKSDIYISHYSIGNSPKFEYLRRYKVDDSWDLDLDKDGKKEYIFQGFIYNPKVEVSYAAGSTSSAGAKTYLQTFIDTAKGQVGEGNTMSKKHGGLTNDRQSWSGAFVRACAARSGGILGVIIPDTISCSAIGNTGVMEGMGSWLDGPALGGRPNPQIGDIALFRMGQVQLYNRLKYAADKAGIVVSVEVGRANLKTGDIEYSMTVVMGDVNGKVASKQYTSLTSTLSGIYRPDWDRVDGTILAPETMQALYGMYTEKSLVEDAAIRDLKYISKDLKPSIKSTGIKLCAINYTGMLANLYGAFAEMAEYLERREDQSDYVPGIAGSSGGAVSDAYNIATGGKVSTSKGDMVLNNEAKLIFGYLNEVINNTAGTIGIMANMWQESGWDPSAVNKSDGGSGLIQWTNTSSRWGSSPRCTNMKGYCLNHGGTWSSNIKGQIEFLFIEATPGSEYYNSDYKKGIDAIKQVANTMEGAKEACKLFLEWYEIGRGNVGSEREQRELNIRQPFAEAAWKLFEGALSYTPGAITFNSESTSEKGQQVVDYASQFVGNRYVWGGTSLTNGCDCSGFTLSVFKKFGVSLPHRSHDQANCGTAVSKNDLSLAIPGDLLYYSHGHVAIYCGNNIRVHAWSSKTGIVKRADAAQSDLAAIRRLV